MSFLLRTLNRALEDGHTALNGELATFYQKRARASWTKDQLLDAEAEGTVIRLLRPDGNLLALPRAAQGEARVARWLRAPRALPSGWGSTLGPPPEALQGPNGACQGAAWNLVGARGTTVITGGPGTGKSFLASLLIKRLSKEGKLIRVASPTAAAASALASKLSGTHVYPQTIHQLLGWIPREDPKRDSSSRIDADVILLDEMSMVDSQMMGYLADAFSDKTQVIFIGDPDQLLPVGAGSPFLDLIQHLPCYHLQTVHRQAEGSGIISFSRAIRDGALEPGHFKLPNIHHFRVADNLVDNEAADLFCSDRLQKKFGVGASQESTLIVSALRTAKRQASVSSLNPVISRRLFPDRIPGLDKFAIGDKVMFTINDKEHGFINGEVGTLEKVVETKNDHILFVSSRYGGTLRMSYRAVQDKIDHAYATTVHKAQGSEADIVILLAPTSHLDFLSMNLIYTAVTRAKKELIIIGSSDVLCRASRFFKFRQTLLSTLLQQPNLIDRLLSPPVPEMDLSKVWG